MKFVCLLSVLFFGSAVLAFPLTVEVPPECADPTFACQDLPSARMCRVVKSCIHDIWSTMAAPDDNDEICDICKEMVKEARDQLLSNMTQEEIKEVFEGSCKLIPIKLIADGCIKVFDEFIPELVEMLASRMDPNMVCTVSGLCNAVSLPIDKKLVKFVTSKLLLKKGDECAECEAVITDVQTFLKSTPESEVKEYVEKFCAEKVSSYMCDIFIDTYFPQIYKYLLAANPKDACASVGACPKQASQLMCNPNGSGVKDELTCEFCEHVLEHIKQMIIANTTMEEFRTALLNFCQHMGTFSNKCTNLVNDYYDMLFDFIRKMDTKGMCTMIGLCTSGNRCNSVPMMKLGPALRTNAVPMMKLMPALRTNAVPMMKLSAAVKKMMKLHPALQVSSNGHHPLVNIIPALTLSKHELREESNEISDLPVATGGRLLDPQMVFEKDTECSICRAFSFFLKQKLDGDRSEEHVRESIAKICSEWTQFQDYCDNFIKYNQIKIEHAMAHGIEYENLCQNLEVCDVDISIPANDSALCDLCKDAMTEIENVLKDPKFKESIESSIDKVCSLCPAKDKCVKFINKNFETVLALLQKELTPNNVCPAIGVCPASTRVAVPQQIKDLECDVCKDVVTSVRHELTDPTAKVVILTFFEEGCARLPGSLAQECKTFIDQNIDTVIGFLINELDPVKVCSLLQICPAQVQELKVNEKVSDVECELCKEVVQKAVDLIGDKPTEDEIREALDKVCTYLPSSMTTRCQQFVDQYTDMLIQLLIQEMDPQTICAALSMCKEKSLNLQTSKVKDVECELCKEVVSKLEDMVKDKKTEDEIRDALDKVCSYLPTSMAANCQKFVDKYSELLITLLAQELDPDMICAAMNLCPEKDIECQGCQYLFHFMQEQFMNSATQDQIKHAVERLCEYLPKPYSSNCDAFFDEYGSALLTLIAQEIDPSSMCWKLQLCTNQTRMFPLILQSPLRSFNFDECSVCTTVVDYLDKLLEEDDVDQEITKLVEKVCTVIPASFADKCSTILETYGPYILQMIGQMADSRQVCQEIDLCSTPPGQVHLIGAHKCTFGPAYWCKSNAHASACKAEDYCKEKMWKN